MGNRNPSSSRAINPYKRHQARRKALQAIYAWQLSADAITTIIAFLLEDNPEQPFERAYFELLVKGVHQHHSRIDDQLVPFLKTASMAEINPVERAILRLGGYELLFCKEIPYKVVLNESIELAKGFGSSEGHRLINGILDKFAQSLNHVAN